MNTKSLHCKHPKKMKSSKDEHEVFVLPPDLLKKLGISIGNINDGQVIATDVTASPSTEVINNDCSQNFLSTNCETASNTSILETASLMKKSVFLSPTFVPTANVIPGEFEIMSKKFTDDSIAVSDLVEAQNSVYVPAESIEVAHILPGSNDAQKECLKVDQAKFHYGITLNKEQTPVVNNNKEYPYMYPDGNQFKEQVNMILDKNVNEFENTHDNILNGGQSFKSNNNVEFTMNPTEINSTCVSSNSTDHNILAPKVSKINIISEETIPLSRLKELKKKQNSNLKNLKPVTVQSVIDTKTSKDDGCSGKKSNIEPTVPLKYTKLLHSELGVDIINEINYKLLDRNEYTQTKSVPTAVSFNGVEENTNTKSNITSNMIDYNNLLGDKQNLKSIKEGTTAAMDFNNKVTVDENSTSKLIKNCQSNFNVVSAEDNNILLNTTAINGFDGNKEMVAIAVDKDIKICDRKMDDCTKFEINLVKKNSTENKYMCNKDKVTHTHTETKTHKQIIVREKNNHTISNKQSGYSQSTYSANAEVKNNTGNKDSSSKKVNDKTLRHDEFASILNASTKPSSSSTDIKADKVKEIAAYLKKFSHIYTDKKKTKKALSKDVMKKEKINSNTNTIESKLCIQGVEKPGGNQVDKEHAGECKVFKTYSKQKPRKVSKILTPSISHKYEGVKFDNLEQVNPDIEAVSVFASSKIQEFCLCDDFGRLAYYDCENLYEHIHFWNHNNANCELDLIYAIYNDEAIVENNEYIVEEEEKTEEKIESVNVCWNILQSEFSENIDDYDTGVTWHHFVEAEIEEVCSGDSSQIIEKVTQESNHGVVSKNHDHLKNSENSDVILETIQSDMVDTTESITSVTQKNIERPLCINLNDNNKNSAIANTTNSGDISSGQSSSQPIIIPSAISKSRSSEISTISGKVCKNKEKIDQSNEATSSAKILQNKEATLDSSKTIQKPTKRMLSEKPSESAMKKSIKCGICSNIFSRADWEDHVACQHDLIAWKSGGSINLNDPELVLKLKERLNQVGELKCSICDMHIRKFNRFMEHIKYCIRKKLSNEDKKADKPSRKSRTTVEEHVTCGVCNKTMLSHNWLEHIGRNHDYLAWTTEQDAVNLDNESEVWQHLQNIIRYHGSLVCFKCGLKRSRVKTYLAHTKTCDGSGTSLNESSMSVDLNSSIIPEDEDIGVTTEAATVTCGVCKQDVTHSEWIEHISKEHNYLAWQEGDAPVDLEEEEAVWNHLQQFIRQNGGLTCHKCGLVRKRVKLYLTHMETCDGTMNQIDNSSNNISLNTTTNSTNDWYEVPIVCNERKIIRCGVCSEEVPILEWLQHIGKEHEYLAWQDGFPPLDLNDELAVKAHLLDVSKQNGGLVCNKCDKRLKYPKTYQQHIKECAGVSVSPDSSKVDDSTVNRLELFTIKKIKDEIVTCAVCAAKVESAKWISHIEIQHQYLAWVEGQPPLDLEDAVMVQKHLNDVSRTLGGLMCTKCGVRRKYVKSYLLHVESCQGKVNIGELSFDIMGKDIVECAICAATMEPKDWRKHAMKEHYNIAWVVGDTPIEINNPYAVESYLKEYHHANNKLTCKVCGISRVSYVGFYAHIIMCGKTEQETEIYKSVCDICQNKYLRIYKSQHMTMHREKEYAMERKLLVAKEKELKNEDEPGDIIQTGRRKAAEKAKHVIEKYKSTFHDGSYHCSKCGFSSDTEKELSDHVCVEDKWDDASDSDVSIKLENCSDEESDESDIDSNVSDEEREAEEQTISYKKKKCSEASKVIRLPYHIENMGAYMKKSTEEFIETYLTDKVLFTQWYSCEIEEVPENEIMNYMPPLEESCKVRFADDRDWVTFNRFESSQVKDTTVMFVGASIQCMSWVPGGRAQLLSVAAHRRADAPRLAWDCAPPGRGLLQIWDCGNFTLGTPQFVLGIAHDFGTVWSIDWCPSGARDASDLVPEPNKMHRLGLLAVACSTGSAYIFLVPYPSSISQKQKPFYKLKPVAELRLTTSENRKIYQATAIKWSVQKGHSHVVVGYADGTTAFYDLNGESPLLRTQENNITVFYPYHDERVQNSCIEDMDLYPRRCGDAGVLCAGGAGGAGAGSAGAGAVAGALQSHVAVARVLYPPHWPAALLTGDDCLVNQLINELEWWGGGRRLGGSSCAAGCAWCGRVVVSAPPLLRLMRLHPGFPDIHKQVIGSIQMVPLGSKRKRQNDELAMIVEPITYDDAVKKYGIDFKRITSRDRTTQQKLSATPRDAYPERFPLSDVAALKFNLTFKHHQKLAIAMHTGLIFIVNV